MGDVSFTALSTSSSSMLHQPAPPEAPDLPDILGTVRGLASGEEVAGSKSRFLRSGTTGAESARRAVTVPMHLGDLPIGTLKSIEKQAGIKLWR
jgi:hypothetical protein